MSNAKSHMFVLLTLLISMGCATTKPYSGKGTKPIVKDTPYTHVNSVANPRNPYWETYHILTFQNPLDHGVSFDVNCRKHEVETFHDVDVPAHTSQDVLINADEGSCEIKRVPARKP